MKDIIDNYRGVMTYREIAEKCGISHVTLYNIINGQSEPKISTLVAIADVIGVDSMDLVKIVVDDIISRHY